MLGKYYISTTFTRNILCQFKIEIKSPMSTSTQLKSTTKHHTRHIPSRNAYPEQQLNPLRPFPTMTSLHTQRANHAPALRAVPSESASPRFEHERASPVPT
ncbi:hypothetical protein M3J09_010679 [Ascochyta lentis]